MAARRSAGGNALMPSRRRPDREPMPTFSIFPDQVHIGDRFTDADTGDEPHEWEVASRPVTFKKGHEVRARVQRPGNPATAREKYWAAHVKIAVRRGTAATNRPTAEPDDAADVDALRRELRRLRAEVLGSRRRSAGPRAAQCPPGARARADAGEDPAGDLDVVERAGPLAEVGDYSFSFSIFPCTVTRNPVPFLAFFASLTISGHHFTSLAACCQMGRSAKLLRKKMVRPESNQAARS